MLYKRMDCRRLVQITDRDGIRDQGFRLGWMEAIFEMCQEVSECLK